MYIIVIKFIQKSKNSLSLEKMVVSVRTHVWYHLRYSSVIGKKSPERLELAYSIQMSEEIFE